jgi:hypothetical protein
MTATAAHLLLTAGGAAAAKIEVDVPDFLVDNNPLDAVLHSPVLAVGAAVLALLLFPKLIRVAINYLIYPVIVALLAYLAISHPEQTANSIYVLLEFIKDHPAASSVAVVVAAGVLLGPDILAGTALAGGRLKAAVLFWPIFEMKTCQGCSAGCKAGLRLPSWPLWCYMLLGFGRDHPAASSVVVVVAAGVLLGPDILAGTALAGGWLETFVMFWGMAHSLLQWR